MKTEKTKLPLDTTSLLYSRDDVCHLLMTSRFGMETFGFSDDQEIAIHLYLKRILENIEIDPSTYPPL